MATLLPSRVPCPRRTVLLESKSSSSKCCYIRRHSSTSSIVGLHTNSTNPQKPALSALPTGALLRSLLISGVLSRPYLLQPSLSILSFLSKPGRSFLFNVDRNPLLRQIIKPTIYAQFCGGENRREVQALTSYMKSVGFAGTILTYSKETVFDHSKQAEYVSDAVEGGKALSGNCSSIQAWRDGTLESIAMLSEGDQIALKLTGAGPRVTEAFTAGELPPQQMLDALDDICSTCQRQKVGVVVDAESQHFQRGISRVNLELMRKYNRDGYALVYHTYQAYLKQTPTTLARHLAVAAEEGWTLGLKLVRGAYLATDKRSLIHDTKEDTDNAYNTIAQGAVRRKLGKFGTSRPFPRVELLLATHNKQSALAAHDLHQKRVAAGLPTVPVHFAQLQGMSDEVSFSLLQLRNSSGEAPKVLKCTTWGTVGQCMAYLMRRAFENRDAVSRTREEYVALKKELWRRLFSR